MRALSDVSDEYIADCYGLTERTRGLYAWHLQRFLKVIGDKPVRQIEVSDLRSFMAGQRKEDGGEYSPFFFDQAYQTFILRLGREGHLEAPAPEKGWGQ